MDARARLSLFGLFSSIILVAPAVAGDAAPPRVKFKKVLIDNKFRSEGVAVADFNGDGLMDVAAGSVYYAAPDWKMHVIDQQPRQYDPKVYSNSFCNIADDVNGDGCIDETQGPVTTAVTAVTPSIWRPLSVSISSSVPSPNRNIMPST